MLFKSRKARQIMEKGYPFSINQTTLFHTTPARKADPGLIAGAGTTIAITTAIGAVMAGQLIVMSGLLVTILSYYLTPGRGAPVGGEEEYDPNILEPIGIPVGLFDVDINIIPLIVTYLTTVGQFGEVTEVILPNLTIDELENVRINVEGLVNMHEIAFHYTNHFTEIWDPSDANFGDMNMFHESWRAAGNRLMEIYRTIEGILGIPRSASRLPTAWYEGW